MVTVYASTIQLMPRIFCLTQQTRAYLFNKEKVLFSPDFHGRETRMLNDTVFDAVLVSILFGTMNLIENKVHLWSTINAHS